MPHPLTHRKAKATTAVPKLHAWHAAGGKVRQHKHRMTTAQLVAHMRKLDAEPADK